MMEPENPRLDDFVLSLARGPETRVCYVPTPTGDSDRAVGNFFRLVGDRCRGTWLPTFLDDPLPARQRLDVDVIYVSGGNTANALAVWKLRGIDVLLREAYERGVILCGLSAGACCWFDEFVTDSFGRPLRGHAGLGLLRGSFCPHYDGEGDRAPTYRGLIEGGMAAGYAADDGAAVHFVDGEVRQVVASRPKARAFRVGRKDGVVTEEALPVRVLP